MKAYPLIYSRTRDVDFVPDFLARPKDLDWKKALEFTTSAMANLDTLNKIRYSTFSVGDYCICGGISCITKLLIEELKKSSIANPIILENAENYIKDCKGRNIAAFIGFAIKKSDLRSGRIPDIQLSDYWESYLNYLKKQWESSDTKSEQLEFSEIEIGEKTYSSLNTPKIEKIREHNIVINFDENSQAVLDYYFDQIINKGKNVSFISDVVYKADFEKLHFTDVHVSDLLYAALKTAPSAEPKESTSFDSVMGSRSPRSASSFGNSNDAYYRFKNNMPSNYNKPDYSSHSDDSKKNSSSVPAAILAAAAVVLVVIIAALKLIKH